MSSFLPQPGHNGWWILAFLHANFKYYVTDRDRSFWFEDVIFPKDPNILITTYFLSRETKCVYELMLFYYFRLRSKCRAVGSTFWRAGFQYLSAPLDCSSNISGPFLCKVLPVFLTIALQYFLSGRVLYCSNPHKLKVPGHFRLRFCRYFWLAVFLSWS